MESQGGWLRNIVVSYLSDLDTLTENSNMPPTINFQIKMEDVT